MQFKICHLYHDVLNLHGDAGNLICLTKRLEWRDIPVSIDCVGIGQECKLSDYDLVFIGGGQEFDYVLEGEMKIELGGNEVYLRAGDSLYYDSSIPHAMYACDKDARFIAVVVK